MPLVFATWPIVRLGAIDYLPRLSRRPTIGLPATGRSRGKVATHQPSPAAQGPLPVGRVVRRLQVVHAQRTDAVLLDDRSLETDSVSNSSRDPVATVGSA